MPCLDENSIRSRAQDSGADHETSFTRVALLFTDQDQDQDQDQRRYENTTIQGYEPGGWQYFWRIPVTLFPECLVSPSSTRGNQYLWPGGDDDGSWRYYWQIVVH